MIIIIIIFVNILLVFFIHSICNIYFVMFLDQQVKLSWHTHAKGKVQYVKIHAP